MRAVVAVLAFVLAACGAGTSSQPPTGTPGPAVSTPSAAPASTAAPSSSPEASGLTSAPPTSPPITPTWTPLPLESVLVNAAVTVLVDRLNVRATPSVTSKSSGIVEVGDVLLVRSDGPVANDGYTWYVATLLVKAGKPLPDDVDLAHAEGLTGWIAASKGSSPYVRQLSPRCPSTIDLASVQYLLGAELLACFGSHTIEVNGTFGCGECGGAAGGSFEPSWLAYPLNGNFVTSTPIGNERGPFAVRFAPGGPEAPPEGSIVRIRGHFNDAAAATCAISLFDPLKPDAVDPVPIPKAAARLVCAQQFVVETVEIIGTDPGF